MANRDVEGRGNRGDGGDGGVWGVGELVNLTQRLIRENDSNFSRDPKHPIITTGEGFHQP